MFFGTTFGRVLLIRKIRSGPSALSNSQFFIFHFCNTRYKWQKKKEIGIENGILYTGAEKGKRITYPGRVGTVDLEGGAQRAIARRAAQLKPIVPTPPECRRDSRITLPKINVARFCNKNGVHAAVTIYPHNLRETLKLRKEQEILGEGKMPKRPVFTHLHTVGGHVTKLINDGSSFT